MHLGNISVFDEKSVEIHADVNGCKYLYSFLIRSTSLIGRNLAVGYEGQTPKRISLSLSLQYFYIIAFYTFTSFSSSNTKAPYEAT